MDLPAPVILWFRDDLRLADHPALQDAVATGRPVIPVHVLDDKSPGQWALGGAARWWLHHSLAALGADLAARGATLILRRGPADQVLPALMRETGASLLVAGASGQPWARAVEDRLTGVLGPDRLRLFRTGMLFDPARLRNKSGGPFQVFTPFARACLTRDDLPPLSNPPERIQGATGVASDTLESWALRPTRPNWATGFEPVWTPGEAGARDRAERFVREALEGYGGLRDRPDIEGSSRLSPHLRFGEIAPQRLWRLAAGRPGADGFLRELLWREFAAHLLWHFPAMPEQPLRPEWHAMPWRDDPAALRAWQTGRTGVPIVDAGMRQLWSTGWMHNRVRMIVGSFLVKHLLLPWQAGEAWFWDTLVDADLATNAMNWQWVAGCGADAAPYFRVFNPVTQGQKFDPEGQYVRRYLPELPSLGSRWIHAPWSMPALERIGAGIGAGHPYAQPIVDLADGRERALRAFAALRGRDGLDSG